MDAHCVRIDSDEEEVDCMVKQEGENSRLRILQAGFSALSVSASNWGGVLRYVANQEHHHNGLGYEDELRQLVDAY